MNHLRHTGIAERLRDVRICWYGEHGAQFFADAIGIPLRTWLNYESGITVPGDIMLGVVVMTRVNPEWLLSGRGEKFDHRLAKS